MRVPIGWMTLGLGASIFALPAHARAQDATCAARVAQMNTRLASIRITPPPIEYAIDGLPVDAGGQALRERGAVVSIQRDFPVVFNGENLGVDDAQAAAILARRVAQGSVLYVAAWPDEPAQRLFRVLGPLVSRRVDLRMLVAPSRPRADPREASRVVQTLVRAAGPCQAVTAALGASSGQGNGRRWLYLRDRVPEAVRSCGCDGVDIARLTSVLLRLGREERPDGWRPLPLAEPGTPAATRLVLPADATVRAAAAALRGLPPGHRLAIAQ